MMTWQRYAEARRYTSLAVHMSQTLCGGGRSKVEWLKGKVYSLLKGERTAEATELRKAVAHAVSIM